MCAMVFPGPRLPYKHEPGSLQTPQGGFGGGFPYGGGFGGGYGNWWRLWAPAVMGGLRRRRDR